MRGICRERSTQADERYLNLFHEEDRDAHEGSVPDPQPVRLHRKTLDQREILCAAVDCIATGVDKEWSTQNRDNPEKMGSGSGFSSLRRAMVLRFLGGRSSR